VKARPADRNFSRNGRGEPSPPAVILFIDCQRPKDNIDRVIGRSIEPPPRRCPLQTKPSSAMDSGSASHDDCHERIWVRARICHPCNRTFTSCPIGWRRPGTTACTAGNRPAPHRRRASASCTAVPDPARLRIHPPCADGHNGDCSACGAGYRPEAIGQHFLQTTHHRCWDLARSADILPLEARSPLSVQALDELNSRFRCWTICNPRIGSRPATEPGSMDGDCVRCTCDRKPSFLVDSSKSLFYCYGCAVAVT